MNKQWTAWLAAYGWALAIYLAIPYARTLQSWLEQRANPAVYLGATVVIGGGLACGAWFGLRRRGMRLPWSRLGWAVVVGGACLWILRTQLQVPVEALHVLEYAILGALVFRAWRTNVKDGSIYPLSLLTVAWMAWGDEFLQWLMPGRFWDFRDIRLNLLAGAMSLLFIAWVVRPATQWKLPSSSVRRLCLWAWVLLLVLSLSLSATPARVDAAALRWPVLGFLRNNPSVMSEYGYRHELSGVGILYSRLPLNEVRPIDQERGFRAGELLRAEHVTEHPLEFRAAHPASVDPFLREAGDHLIRRDHYFGAAWQYQESDPGRFALHLKVALGENRILEGVFPNVLDGAERRWPVARSEICAKHAGPLPYESNVANHLITRVTESQARGLLLALAGLVGWVWFRWGRNQQP